MRDQLTLRSNTSVLLITILSSSSLSCPVVWGRRYSCLSYSSMLLCLLSCPVSAPPLSYLSYTHLVGLYLRLVPGIYHSSQYVLLFHPHRMAVPLQSFFCNFLGRFHHSCCPSNVFILDFIPSCHSAHPSQHPHLIYFQSCFLSPRCCPGIRTIQQSRSDHSLVNLSLQFVSSAAPILKQRPISDGHQRGLS